MSKKVVKNEAKKVEKTTEGKASIDKTPRELVSGGKFHDFNAEPTFEGIYKHPVLAEKDNEQRNQKAGDVIGYAHEDEEGNEIIVGASASVVKAIDQVEPGAQMRYEFLGKGESNGKPFNRFKIELLGYVDLK